MNEDKVIVLAPTLAMGNQVARDFLIPRKNVYSRPQSLRGMSDRVILLYEPQLFTDRIWEEIKAAFVVGRHTVVQVPEYQVFDRASR